MGGCSAAHSRWLASAGRVGSRHATPRGNPRAHRTIPAAFGAGVPRQRSAVSCRRLPVGAGQDVPVIRTLLPWSRSAPRVRLGPDFTKLWLGRTVSELGSGIGATALPLAAVLVLKATPLQMGLLAAISTAPVLIVGLPAGAWVDRLRRRPVLIAADVGRAVLLASIPLAALLHVLDIEQLYVVAALVGVLTVFFDAADQAFLPSMVPRENLVVATSTLGASDSVAEIGGPALAGVLVQWLRAPV